MIVTGLTLLSWFVYELCGLPYLLQSAVLVHIFAILAKMQGYRVKDNLENIFKWNYSSIYYIQLYKRYSDLQRYKPLLFKRPTQI